MKIERMRRNQEAFFQTFERHGAGTNFQRVVVEAIFFIPQSMAIKVVHRIHNLDKVLEEFTARKLRKWT